MTKVLCMVWAVGHFVWTSKQKNQHRGQNANKRSVLDHFLFSSTGELVVGAFFLVQFLRRLERELGSRKLVAWMLYCFGLAAALELILVATTATDSGGVQQVLIQAPKGPYPLIGGVLYWYYRFVPRLHPRFVSVVGMSVSEKGLHYLWATYLVCSQGWNSAIFGVLGGLASALFFHVPILPQDLPNLLVDVLPWESIGSFFLLDPPPKIYAPFLSMGGGTRHHQHANNRAAVAPPPRREAPTPPAPPPQGAIDQLTAMGFEEDRVREALQQTNNSIERAADRLLMG